MSYIDKNLLDGETLVYRARMHKIIFLWPLAWLVLAAGFLFLGMVYGKMYYPMAGLFGVAALVHFLVLWVHYRSSEFAVTTQRVVCKVGFIRRNTMEVFLKRIESVKVNQTLWGRLLNFGTILVTGTGGVNDPFEKISAPFEFRRQVQQQLAHL